ncbi:MAG TPA: phosphotransferase [Chloroflexota bacterium]|nr:phosphotransferase [Chloroflexota bacterium]
MTVPSWSSSTSRGSRALAESLADVLRARHPAADVLLHGDLVPTNVLVTGAGPSLIDPVGRRGLAAWDLAQLAVAAEGRGQRRLLGALVQGYGSSPPLVGEIAAWMLLFYLAKNLAQPGSPFAPRLRRLADALLALGDPVRFVERHLL